MEIDLAEDYGFRLFVLFIIGLLIYGGLLVIGEKILTHIQDVLN